MLGCSLTFSGTNCKKKPLVIQREKIFTQKQFAFISAIIPSTCDERKRWQPHFQPTFQPKTDLCLLNDNSAVLCFARSGAESWRYQMASSTWEECAGSWPCVWLWPGSSATSASGKDPSQPARCFKFTVWLCFQAADMHTEDVVFQNVWTYLCIMS